MDYKNLIKKALHECVRWTGVIIRTAIIFIIKRIILDMLR